MRWRWGWFWFAVLTAVLCIELYAVWSPAAGDTLSEAVIPLLMAYPALWWGSLVLWLAFSGWLLFHWWFEYRDTDRRGP